MATHRLVSSIFPFLHGLAAMGGLLVTFLTQKRPAKSFNFRPIGPSVSVLRFSSPTVEPLNLAV